ncbi:hypothetical protein A2U01_0037973, partial [Trifolium medium]|nr:hypothetical protein [Trifolium medium]
MEETGPSSPKGKGAMASAEPHAEPVAEPHLDPAPEAEDDGEQLGEADFQEEKANQGGPPHKKLEGPHWSECIFGDEEPDEFPGGSKDKTVLAFHGRKLGQFDLEVPNEEWFISRLAVIGLADLAK